MLCQNNPDLYSVKQPIDLSSQLWFPSHVSKHKISNKQDKITLTHSESTHAKHRGLQDKISEHKSHWHLDTGELLEDKDKRQDGDEASVAMAANPPATVSKLQTDLRSSVRKLFITCVGVGPTDSAPQFYFVSVESYREILSVVICSLFKLWADCLHQKLKSLYLRSFSLASCRILMRLFVSVLLRTRPPEQWTTYKPQQIDGAWDF